MRMRLILICALSIGARPNAEAQTPSVSVPAKPPVGLVGVSPNNYTLGPEDVLQVQVRDVEEIGKQPVRIDAEGDIRLPMAGGVKATGLTPRQLEGEIAKKLRHLVRNPEVVVSVVEQRSQPVSVLGAVRSPGVFQIQSKKTLVEVLSMAGGLKDDAATKIKITRRTNRGPLPVKNAIVDGEYQVAEISVASVLNANNPAENFLVEPHDVITVPEAQLVFVMGHVKKPGGFPMREESRVSALQALSMAEGPAPTGAPKHGRILRKQPGLDTRLEIAVDLNKVMSGKAPDVAMLPGDILVIPNNLPKNAFLRSVEAAVQIGTGLIIWGR
jgi:polysaccharide export outer membrane protein